MSSVDSGRSRNGHSQVKYFCCVMFVGILCFGTALRTAKSAERKKQDNALRETVRPFLKQYCYECHGATEQYGERRFDELKPVISADSQLVDYQDILDQLNLGEMPPSDELQPSNEQRQAIVDILTREIGSYHESRVATESSEVVLRRLNAREYRNAVRDLFAFNMDMFDPAKEFPKDQTLDHLENVGDTLVTSGYLLSKYLESAEAIVEKALYPLNRPEVRTWEFHDGFRQQPEIDQVLKRFTRFEHLTLYDAVGADKHEGAYAPIHAFANGVPYDGYYTIKFQAGAFNRDHQYDDNFFGTDRNEPFRLGIVVGNHDVGPLHKPQPVEPMLAEFELTDEMAGYKVRVWMDRGYTPRFTFRNGLMDVRNIWGRIHKKYPDLLPQKGKGIVFNRRNAITNGKMPHIRVDDIVIEGPFYDSWPRRSQRALLGEEAESILATKSIGKDRSKQLLIDFAARAFRREVTLAEVEKILRLVESQKEKGRSGIEAFADGINAILCSPSFLYWDEGSDVALHSSALVNRLSSFLWASVPDEDLLAQELAGDPAKLQMVCQEMLRDARRAGFVSGFLDSWLTLSDLGSTPPDRSAFSSFYHYDLDSAMRTETRMFFEHVLDENLSVLNFLDSDFTFVNKRLAMHYGLEVPNALKSNPFQFKKVSLPTHRRGGLLGQASVLTVSANGIDTSPVVRGVWLLENVLGTPPSPPPPDVEPLDPDVRGAKTIRDQLTKHRSDPNCNSCHQRIDPLGFALENFDPIGGWRAKYSHGAKVDASGELPNGSSFKDVTELKQVLLSQKPLFVKALTEKMLRYAIGRRLGPQDRPHVDAIMKELESRGLGLRDLVELIVQSEPFRSR